MKRALVIPVSVVIFFGLLAAGAWLYMKTAMHGFSARAEPSRTETMLATYARNTAMPSSAKDMNNPVRPSPDVLNEAMAHFADHCAVCHGNNGNGETMFGKGMYPKPPDLRLSRTQDLTDGEIFYIIENGIRMSGMPAFGGADTADQSWKLAYFIRHLPHLTPAEENQMESLNPKSPDEFREEQEEQNFLNGGTPSSKLQTSTHHH